MLFFLEVTCDPNGSLVCQNDGMATTALDIDHLFFHVCNFIWQQDVFSGRNEFQNIRTKPALSMVIVAPSKDVLIYKSPFQVSCDFKPQLLVLIHALDAEVVYPEVLVEVLDHGARHLLVYGHLGGVREA